MLLIAKVDKKNKITNSCLSVHLFFRREEKGDQKRLKNYQRNPVHNFVVHNFVD